MPTGVEEYRNGTTGSSKSLGELVGDLTRDLGKLVRQEVQLARVETTQKITATVKGAALLIVAGVLGFVAFEALVACGILALAQVVSPWLAALIVGGALLVIAGILAFIGINNAKKIADPVPHATVETLKEDAQWIKQQVQ
jgi:uncharacterized membrane protein YqjE